MPVAADLVVPLTLIAVDDLGPAHRAGARAPFSLIFLGPQSDHYVPQGTYLFALDDSESLPIFITPIGPDAGQQNQMRYQAIFS